MHDIHDAAEASGLFRSGDIKVRVRPYNDFIVANTMLDFIHVFGHIMEGRTIDQRAALSRSIVGQLASSFPEVSVISMNISEFEKSTYCNRQML